MEVLTDLPDDLLEEIARKFAGFAECFAFARTCQDTARVMRERRNTIIAANSRTFGNQPSEVRYTTFGVVCRIQDGRLCAAVIIDGRETVWHDNRGRRHRGGDEPARTTARGTREWYYRGKLHRNNGPAVILPNGRTEFWQYGRRVDNFGALSV